MPNAYFFKSNNKGRFIATKSLLALCILFTRPASAAPSFELKLRPGPASAQAEFVFDAHPEFTTSIEDHELLLCFDRPIDPPPMDSAVATFGDWISWVSMGFDTMLIRTAANVGFHISTDGNRVVIDFMRTEGEPQAEDLSAAMRFALLQTKLLSATGHSAQARGLLKGLLDTHPADPQVFSGLAEVEMQLGHWRRAAGLYGRAIQLQPGNEDLIEARRRIFQDRSPSISENWDHKNVKNGWSEFVFSTTAAWPAGVSNRMGVTLQADRFLPSAKTDGSFHTFLRRRAEAFVQHDFESGPAVRGSIHGNGRTWGGSGSYSSPDSRGSMRIEADYAKSFWDLIDSIEGYGVRDRIFLGRAHRVGTRVNANVGAAGNRYRMGESSALTTYAFNTDLHYELVQGLRSVDLQYVLDMERRSGRLGLKNIPLSNRNVHAVGISATLPIRNGTHVRSSFGFSMDRGGGRGPFSVVQIDHRIGQTIAAEFWFERRQNSILTSQTVSRIGAQIVIQFPGHSSSGVE